METYKKNKMSFILFVIFIIGLIVGGYYLITAKKNNNLANDTTTNVNIKKDKNKDYIYLTDNTCLSTSLQICYPTINININTQEASDLQDKLNEQMKNLDRNYIKISEINTTDKEILYYDDDIYSANVIDYNYYFSSKTVSLSVTSYRYYATGDMEDLTQEIYNFSVEKGNILSNTELLSLYGYDMEDIINKIKENEKLNEINDNLKNSIKIIVDDNDNFIVNYIVTTGENSYNNSITIFN